MMPKVSCHGGHSGEYCCHARDTLAEMVAEYFRQGFSCVCLTEHMPPISDEWLYPDERDQGVTAAALQQGFARYLGEAKRLAKAYSGQMTVLVGMETEWYPGCEQTIARWRPELDVVIGSVHHVRALGFDYSAEEFAAACRESGGLIQLYCDYFDAQFAMFNAILPDIVGHFDLIRLFDPNYQTTVTNKDVWARVERNLEWIRRENALLDVNARALLKGSPEPYVCKAIRTAAAQRGICMLPGDDSHSVKDVGKHLDVVRGLLEKIDCCQWFNGEGLEVPWATFFSRHSKVDGLNKQGRSQP